MEQRLDDPEVPELEELLQRLADIGGANDRSLLKATYLEGTQGQLLRADDACWHLACMFRSGEGAPKDPEKARQWALRAAECGVAKAQYEMGRVFRGGEGVPQDYERAAYWFRLAAAQGNAWAQGNLGTLYAQGLGVPQDQQQALRWWQLAAEQGHEVSLFNLGLWHDLAEDFEAAAEYYRRAAELGHVGAAQNLAALCQRGKGSPRNE